MGWEHTASQPTESNRDTGTSVQVLNWEGSEDRIGQVI